MAELAAERELPEHLSSVVPDPGRPRFDQAPSLEKPNPSKTRGNRTVLQSHAAFFDFDNDGVLSLEDTFKGMRSTGFSLLLAALGTFIIHASFSLPTTPPVEVRLPGFLGGKKLFALRLPDPFLRVFISNVHKGKHGSDSGTYDTEGRFVPERLEECFSKYAGKGDAGSSSSASSVSMTPGEIAKKKVAATAASLTLDETEGKTSAGSVVDAGTRDSLTWSDIRLMLQGNRSLFDPFGTVAAFLEWGGLFWLAAQQRASDGRFVITRERARAAADGSLFSLLKADRERAAEAAREAKARRGEHAAGAKEARRGAGAAAAARLEAVTSMFESKRSKREGAKSAAAAEAKKGGDGGAGGGSRQQPSSSSGSIPAGRRTPTPATQVDFAPPAPSSQPASAKKAQ